MTRQAPESPWSLVGSLDGHTVKLYPDGGARARIAYDALTAPKPAGWLEFRHGATVRSRYVSPTA